MNPLIRPDDLPDCLKLWFYLRVRALTSQVESGIELDLEVPLRLVSFSYPPRGKGSLRLTFEEQGRAPLYIIEWPFIVSMTMLPIAKGIE